VFSLAPDQAAVSTNVPKSEVYVVRMIELTPFNDLWEKYAADDTSRDYLQLMNREIGFTVASAWRQQIMDDAGFKREKPPTNDKAPLPAPSEGTPPPEDF